MITRLYASCCCTRSFPCKFRSTAIYLNLFTVVSGPCFKLPLNVFRLLYLGLTLPQRVSFLILIGDIAFCSVDIGAPNDWPDYVNSVFSWAMGCTALAGSSKMSCTECLFTASYHCKVLPVRYAIDLQAKLSLATSHGKDKGKPGRSHAARNFISSTFFVVWTMDRIDE
jgi:hypothetical protein